MSKDDYQIWNVTYVLNQDGKTKSVFSRGKFVKEYDAPYAEIFKTATVIEDARTLENYKRGTYTDMHFTAPAIKSKNLYCVYTNLFDFIGSPFQEASIDDTDTIKTYYEHGVLPENMSARRIAKLQGVYRETVLHIACAKGDFPTVQRVIPYYEEPSHNVIVYTMYLQTALHALCSNRLVSTNNRNIVSFDPSDDESNRIKILDLLYSTFGVDNLKRMALVDILNRESDEKQTNALQEMAISRSGAFVKRLLELLDDDDMLFVSKKAEYAKTLQRSVFLLPVHHAAIHYNYQAIREMKMFLLRGGGGGESDALARRLLLESSTYAPTDRESTTALSYAYLDNVTDPKHIETILECVQYEASAFSFFIKPSGSLAGVKTITELEKIVSGCKTVLERALAVNHGLVLVFIKDIVSRNVVHDMTAFVFNKLHRFYPSLVETIKRSHHIEEEMIPQHEMRHKSKRYVRETVLRGIRERSISESDAIDIITKTGDSEIAFILQSYFVNVSLFISVPIDNPASLVLRQMVPVVKREAQTIMLFSNNNNSCWYDTAVVCVAASVKLAEARGFNPAANYRHNQKGINKHIMDSVVSLDRFPVDWEPNANKNWQERESAVNAILHEEKIKGRPMQSSNLGFEYAARAFLMHKYEVGCVIGNPQDVFCEQHYTASLASPDMVVRKSTVPFSINRRDSELDHILGMKNELLKIAAMSVFPRCASIVNNSTCQEHRRSQARDEVLVFKSGTVVPPPLIPVELNRKYTSIDSVSKKEKAALEKYKVSFLNEENVTKIVPLIATYINDLAEYALSGIIIGNNVHFVCFFLINTTWFFHDALAGPEATPVTHSGHPLSNVPEAYENYAINLLTYHRVA